MAHCVVPEAEAILDKEYRVLDKGFVRLVDYLGGDERIVQAARVSYGAGTKSYREDRGLINYLLRNEHTSPFEQVVLTFHTKMPVFVARQWVRHRTARLNEISGRYSVMEEQFYVPAPADIAMQSADNKQGRQGDPVEDELASRIIAAFSDQQSQIYRGYQQLLDTGLARELARINLPLSLYTQWYWQIDLHNLFRFLALRMDAHAQYEIRAYANALFDITRVVCPIAAEAFGEHVLGGVRFSQSEAVAVRAMVHNDDSLERVRRAAQEAGVTGKALERLLDKLRPGQGGDGGD